MFSPLVRCSRFRQDRGEKNECELPCHGAGREVVDRKWNLGAATDRLEHHLRRHARPA